jgi:ribonuclease BN (tRNA processing enzyme)
MADLIFVGTGEAFDSALPTTSLLYRGGRTILFDCGYAVPHALWRISRDPDLLDAIYITHGHADHSFGLPPLLTWMWQSGRQRPLVVIGGHGVESWLRQLLEMGYPGGAASRLPLVPTEISPDRPLWLGPVQLRSAYSVHGVDNLSVRWSEGSTALCYSGDGAPSEATRQLYQRASVLVHECFTLDGNVAGHAGLRALVDAAQDGQIGTLCLVHLAEQERPSIVSAVTGLAVRPRILVPRPGDCLTL